MLSPALQCRVTITATWIRRSTNVGPKISIIGAGSAVFSLSLIRDLSPDAGIEWQHGQSNGHQSGQARCDSSADRALCRRDVRRYHRDENDRPESVAGGSRFRYQHGPGAGSCIAQVWLEIAQRHGYRFGGSLHVMHDEAFWINFPQLKFFDEVVRDVLEICPNAWYLQVANPVLAGITHSRKPIRS